MFNKELSNFEFNWQLELHHAFSYIKIERSQFCGRKVSITIHHGYGNFFMIISSSSFLPRNSQIRAFTKNELNIKSNY